MPTWNTFLPRSGFDLSNYYTTAQTYNIYEIEDRLDGKQDKLTFGYDENSAISSINNSALAGSNGDETPWISGAKILADTQTMTDNMIIQVLSSFTLSGNKNHCIAVKGGTYRFPNAYELGDRIATTNFFMATSSMSSYLPVSSFSSYTTYAEGRMDSIFQLANSAYTTAVNNYYNKLDVSSFSSWSANLSNEYLERSESANFYPMVGNPSGFLTQHQDLSYISGKIDDKLDTTALENLSGDFYPMTGNPSGFLTSHQSLTDYYKKTETSSKEEISAAIAAIPLGDAEVNNVVHNYSANGVWLTAHQDLSNYATTAQIEQISAVVSSIPTLSGGEGVQLVNEDNKTRIDLGLSAGTNMSFVYDQETNVIRMDCEATDGNSAVNNYVETHSATINGMSNSAWIWNQVADVIRTYSGQWLLANP